MTLTQLKYFCETCRCHSITGAANELFVTQPAISLAIKELESEFGITLFTRLNNKLTLTNDGAQFYEKAVYILQYCNDMQLELSNNGKQQHSLKIGIPPVLSRCIPSPLIISAAKPWADWSYPHRKPPYGHASTHRVVCPEKAFLPETPQRRVLPHRSGI